MIIRLTEEQLLSIINKRINEAMSENFSFDMLKSIRSLNGRLKYCKKHLGLPIGKGSSRVCFQLDDDRILKLAINNKGIAQNEVEGRPDWYLDSMHIKPTVFDETDFDDYLFIVCEYVLPANKKDFPKMIGMTWNKYVDFVKTCICQRKGGTPPIDWETFVKIIENNEKLHSINDYIANYYTADAGDLCYIRNYGLSKDKGIVILDTGLDDEVYRKYYQRN